jgi:hypothetical protein
MKIDHSQKSSPENKDFEYDYHSAEKGGAGAAIETSMQSYSRHIARHLGSASKKNESKIIQNHLSEDESSEHEKDDIQTNGYGGNGTHRMQENNFDNIQQISDGEQEI